jgi:MFS family permease
LCVGQPDERAEHRGHKPFLGPMRRDLSASSAVMQMAVSLSKLMLGAFMLAGGVAGDIYGRRRVLVLGSVGMMGAS